MKIFPAGIKKTAKSKAIASELVEEIKSGKNKWFGYSHFDISNFPDYDSIKTAVEDIASVYNISDSDAVEVVNSLLHGEKVQDDSEDDFIPSVEKQIKTPLKTGLPPSEPGWD